MIIMPLKYTNLKNLAQICDFFFAQRKNEAQRQTVGARSVNKTSPFLCME